MKVYNVSLTYSCVREEEKPLLSNPASIYEYIKDVFEVNPEQESVWVIFLNNRNYPKGRLQVSLGTANESMAHPRDIFKGAILANATSIVLVHNHPSGDPAPSNADIALTRRIRECGETLMIRLLDHIICGEKESDPMKRGFYSFREVGLIP